jgi:hypothetical protein
MFLHSCLLGRQMKNLMKRQGDRNLTGKMVRIHVEIYLTPWAQQSALQEVRAGDHVTSQDRQTHRTREGTPKDGPTEGRRNKFYRIV